MEQMSLRLATEVRHSLHIMLGFLELAVEDPLSLRQQMLLTECRTGADRLLRIAGDLGELAQPETARQPVSSFQVAAAVAEVTDLERVFAERKGLALECVLSAGSHLRIEGARGLLQDILRRLVDNAVQFTERGHIRLSVEVHLAGDWAVLKFEVADTGTGIPEDVLAALRSTGATLQERGLSLSVVRLRIARMNGEFSVVSSPAAGTIVRLAIPARLALEEEPQPRVGAEKDGPLPLRLLVVDDSEDGFFLFQGYVRDQGYKVTRAQDGAEAVQMVQAEEYDLIMMDANMPIMNGYAATRAIREWESSTGRSERMPIVLFSADDPSKQVKLGGAAGCSGYLPKPASKAELLTALKFFAPRARVL